MNNLRLQQLIEMYIYITGDKFDKAKKIILSTFAGRAIAKNNPAYLYEQQTNNLLDIISELPTTIQKKFSDKKIQEAIQIINYPISTQEIQISSLPDYKIKNNKHLLHLQEKLLTKNSQNLLLISNLQKKSTFISKHRLMLQQKGNHQDLS